MIRACVRMCDNNPDRAMRGLFGLILPQSSAFATFVSLSFEILFKLLGGAWRVG